MLTWNELVTRDELKKEYWNAANALDVAYNHFNNKVAFLKRSFSGLKIE